MNAEIIETIHLKTDDIVDCFDLPLFRYIQGCTYHNHYLFSVEGFGDDTNPGYLRIIDTKAHTFYSFNLLDIIGALEPESVFIRNNLIHIIDYSGQLFIFKINN